MNADFEYRHHSPDLDIEETLQSPSDLQVSAPPVAAPIAPERFELLSAYVDGEASPDQRKQVEAWLDHEPDVQRLYTHLLRLRETFKSLPLPDFATTNAEDLAAQVFRKVDRQPRIFALWAGAGAVIAATCVAMVSGMVSGNRLFLPETASHNSNFPQSVAFSPSPASVLASESESLMISLERPVMDIPQATLVDWNNNSNN